MRKVFARILAFIPTLLIGKTLVFTTAFNRPDFIELQHRLFNKFLADEYEYVVVSDANTPIMRSVIENKCTELGIRCINVPQEIHDIPYLYRNPAIDHLPNHNPNVRHCNSAQWAWDHYFSKHEGPVMLIDSDLFLIRPFSVEKFLGENHLGGIYWGTEDHVTKQPCRYLWLVLILFNNQILPGRQTICFNCGVLPGTNIIGDSGGWTKIYMDKYKDVLKIRDMNLVQGNQFYCPYRYGATDQSFDTIPNDQIIANLSQRGFTKNEIELALKKPYTIELFGDNHFLHYRAGTNYEKYSDSFLSFKDKILLEFFEKILSE